MVGVGICTIGIGVVTGEASAHHPEITGTTSCRPTEQSPWTVQWSIQNSETDPQHVMHEEWSTLDGGTFVNEPSPDDVPASGFATATSTHPASQTSATLTYRGVWRYDGVELGTDRSFTVDRPPVCPDGSTTTTSGSTTTTSG